jgi:predicted transcriptional regulator
MRSNWGDPARKNTQAGLRLVYRKFGWSRAVPIATIRFRFDVRLFLPYNLSRSPNIFQKMPTETLRKDPKKTDAAKLANTLSALKTARAKVTKLATENGRLKKQNARLRQELGNVVVVEPDNSEVAGLQERLATSQVVLSATTDLKHI